MRMWCKTHPEALLDPVPMAVLVPECAAGDAQLREVPCLDYNTPNLRQREVDIIIDDLQAHEGPGLSLDGEEEVG